MSLSVCSNIRGNATHLLFWSSPRTKFNNQQLFCSVWMCVCACECACLWLPTGTLLVRKCGSPALKYNSLDETICSKPPLPSLSSYRPSISRNRFSLDNWRVRQRKDCSLSVAGERGAQCFLLGFNEYEAGRMGSGKGLGCSSSHRYPDWIWWHWRRQDASVYLVDVGVFPRTAFVVVIDHRNVTAAAIGPDLLWSRPEKQLPFAFWKHPEWFMTPAGSWDDVKLMDL